MRIDSASVTRYQALVSDERSMTTQSTRIAELEALVAAFSSELKSSRAQIASVADHTRAPGTWRAGGAWG